MNTTFHFISDKICKRCNTNIRYIKNKHCVQCHKVYERKRYNDDVKPWRENRTQQRKKAGISTFGRIPDINKVPSTRDEGKSLGTTYYFDGIACKHGHVANKYVRNAECCVCRKIQTNKYNNSLPKGTLYLKYQKEYRLKRKENDQV